MLSRLHIILLSATGLAAVAAVLFLARPSPAAPAISWTPTSLTEAILAGDAVTVPVSFTSSKQLTDVVVRVVPQLAPYVAVQPASFAAIGKGESVALNITISASEESLLGTFDGTVHLERANGPARTFAKPLSIVFSILEPVSEMTSGVTFGIPANTLPEQLEDRISVRSAPFDPTLPPLIIVDVIDVTPALAALSTNDALLEIANLQFQPGEIVSLEFHDGGLEVEALSFSRRHFFFYDPQANRAVEITSPLPGFFSSQTFDDLLRTLEF